MDSNTNKNSANSVNALLLLFVFDKMDIPITENTVAEVVCTINNWINYMDYRQAWSLILNKSWIAQINPHASETDAFYTLTVDGRVCLSQLFFYIPSSIRAEVVEYVNLNRMRYRRKQEYSADYAPNDDGSYTVMLRIADTNRQILQLEMNVETRQLATEIYKKWEEKAPEVYSMIYEHLLG